MKLRTFISTLVLTAVIGSGATFADINNEFITRGGDEFVSLEEVTRLGVGYSSEDGSIVINSDLKFDEIKDCLKEAGKIYIPFKSTMEAANIDFAYTSKDTMTVKKAEVESNYSVKYIKATPMATDSRKTYKSDKDKNEYKDDKKTPVSIAPQEKDMKFLMVNEIQYANLKSLEGLGIEMNYAGDNMVFKNLKNDMTHNVSVKSTYTTFEAKKNLTRVPLIEILEGLHIVHQELDEKIVVELEGSQVIFHN